MVYSYLSELSGKSGQEASDLAGFLSHKLFSLHIHRCFFSKIVDHPYVLLTLEQTSFHQAMPCSRLDCRFHK